MSFLNFLDRVLFIYFTHEERVKKGERVRITKSVKLRIACYSVLVCSELLA